METLTINHPRWREFTEDLYALIGEGCTNSHAGTIKILEEMGGFDVAATLEYLRQNGGCCVTARCS
jgi:hypothetical protein